MLISHMSLVERSRDILSLDMAFDHSYVISQYFDTKIMEHDILFKPGLILFADFFVKGHLKVFYKGNAFFCKHIEAELCLDFIRFVTYSLIRVKFVFKIAQAEYF